MNLESRLSAKNVYKEYRQAYLKVGDAAANVQYIHSQANWIFLLLVDYFHLHVIVSSSKESDRVQTSVRSSTQLLTNEVFLQDHGQYLADILDMFDELEHDISSLYRPPKDLIRQVYQGIVYLPTRNLVIKHMVQSRPLDFDVMIDHLLKCVHHLPSKYFPYLSDTAFAMIETQPHQALRLRYQLTELRILPNLIMRLTVDYCHDDYADFLNGVFSLQPSWFLVQSTSSSILFTQIKTSIMEELANSIQAGNTSCSMSITRAICGLVAFFGVKFTDQEVQQYLRLLSPSVPEQLVKVVLCLVLISADQMMKHQKTLTEAIIQLIQSDNCEMPLLLMAYFQTDQIGQIEETIRSLLRVQVPIPKIGLFEIQKLFKTIDSYL